MEFKMSSTKSPEALLGTWLKKLSSVASADEVQDLFREESYWRDLLAVTWTIETVQGPSEIAEMLLSTRASNGPLTLTLETATVQEVDGVVEGWFQLTSGPLSGRGKVQLLDGRCWTLFTAADSLTDHPEAIADKRPAGAIHRADKERVDYARGLRKTQEELGRSEQPYCVIIGGGQAGIGLAARLKALDVPTLVLDKHARPGDCWRKRYRTLTLHDAVWGNHLPYLPFPPTWPIYTPKDKVGDWFESYVSTMELNYWTGTTALNASYDETTASWALSVDKDGEEITLHPKHIVLATGLSGAPYVPKLAGADEFLGKQIHSHQFVHGGEYSEQRCVVIGSNSSAHDICVDLWENGADVTMLQRSPTTVVRVETSTKLNTALTESNTASWSDVEKADLEVASLPYALMPPVLREKVAKIKEMDGQFYKKLEDVGFMLDFGEDETGIGLKYVRTGGGYYIDVGGSDLLINGDIKLVSRVGVERLTPNGLILSDGREIPADLIVYATGYNNMSTSIASLFSPKVANQLGPVWGYGSDTRGDPGPWLGELRNMWKPTGQPGLWIHGGNLSMARHYSRYVALQIKARQLNIPVPIYRKNEADWKQ